MLQAARRTQGDSRTKRKLRRRPIVERKVDHLKDPGLGPAFHRRRYDRLADLEALLQDWLRRYDTSRRNYSAYLKSRTPKEVLAAR